MKADIRYRMIKYSWVALGCVLSSISINLFLVPHQLLSGGVSGLAIISYFWFGFPIGLQLLIMNIPLLYAAYKFLGKEYTITTIFGTVVFSGAVDATRFLIEYSPLANPMLAAVAAGIVSGLGSGVIFRANGSAGGLDIVAAIVKKYYSLNFGVVGFGINCLIMLLAATLFGLERALLTLIAMFIAANITDKVVEGFNRKKIIHIVSYKTDEIVTSILREVGRGVTILEGQGAFTRQQKQVIFVVVSLTQISKIKFLIENTDPNAFMIVSDAVEVMGRGFTLPGSRDM